MNRQTRNFTVAAMLSAVSFVLAFLRLPMPLAPAFAQMDLSDLPALLAAFSLGPSWAVLVELVKICSSYSIPRQEVSESLPIF